MQVDFTCASYAGDRVLYIGSNVGIISAWDTKKNVCLIHWEADKCEISELGYFYDLSYLSLYCVPAAGQPTPIVHYRQIKLCLF